MVCWKLHQQNLADFPVEMITREYIHSYPINIPLFPIYIYIFIYIYIYMVTTFKYVEDGPDREAP